MKKPRKFSDFQISCLPNNFVFCADFPNKVRKFGLSDQGFLTRIVRRYALISSFVKMPLYFLYFKIGSEFFKIQPLSLSILVKNYFSIRTLINKHSEAKNIINTTLLDSPPMSEILMSGFPDLSFFPVLPFSNSEKIGSQIQSNDLNFQESSFRFPSIPSLPIFPSYSEIYSNEHLKFRMHMPRIISSSDKVDSSINAHTKKDELPINSAHLFSNKRLNTEGLYLTAVKDFYFAKAGLNVQEPDWIISKDEKRNNRISATQLRPLRGKIESSIKDTDFIGNKLRRFRKKQISRKKASAPFHEAYEEGAVKDDISSLHGKSWIVSQNAEEMPLPDFLTTKIPLIYTMPLGMRHPAAFSPENYFSPGLSLNSSGELFSGQKFRVPDFKASETEAIKDEIYFRRGHFVDNIQSASEKRPQRFHGSKVLYAKEMSSELRYAKDFPSLVYSPSNQSKISQEPIKEEEASWPSQSSNLAPSPSFSKEPGAVQSASTPEAELANLTDRVYSLIEERVRRERDMRGY